MSLDQQVRNGLNVQPKCHHFPFVFHFALYFHGRYLDAGKVHVPIVGCKASEQFRDSDCSGGCNQFRNFHALLPHHSTYCIHRRKWSNPQCPRHSQMPSSPSGTIDISTWNVIDPLHNWKWCLWKRCVRIFWILLKWLAQGIWNKLNRDRRK